MLDAPPSERFAQRLSAARARTLELIGPVAGDDVDRQQHPLMSPLAWDLGHIAAYEDLWLVHRAGGLPLLRPDLLEVYDAFETPRTERGDALPTCAARTRSPTNARSASAR